LAESALARRQLPPELPMPSPTPTVRRDYDPATARPGSVAEYEVWLDKIHHCPLTRRDREYYETVARAVLSAAKYSRTHGGECPSSER
jgi:hypothetical protein